MNVYIAADKNGYPTRVCWTREEAEAWAWSGSPSGAVFVAVPLDNIRTLVAKYFGARKFVVPSREQAFLFLTSELGELADALVSNQEDWVRSDETRERSIENETADVLMMLIMTLGEGDLINAMVTKFKQKGFDPNDG